MARQRSRPQPILAGPESTRPEVAETFENSVALAGLEEAADVSAPNLDEHNRIEAFASSVENELAGWASKRGTGNLVYDTSRLNRLASQFRNHYIAEFGYPPRDEEVAATLLRGTNRDTVREISSFLPASRMLNADYFGYLNLDPADQVEHTYDLQVLRGVSVSALLGGRMVDVQLSYSNDVGMAWEIVGTMVLATGTGQPGLEVGHDGELGGGGGGLGAALLLQGDTMRAAPTRWYFSPEDFSSAAAYTIDLEVEAGVEVGIGGFSAGPEISAVEVHGITLENSGRDLSFFEEQYLDSLDDLIPEVGHGLKEQEDGADLVEGSAGVGATLRAGLGMMSDARDFQLRSDPTELREEEAPAPANPEILLESTLYFRTGEASLGPEDEETLRAVLVQMDAVQQQHPGALYDLDVVGFASNRWRGARDESEAIELNRILAAQRAMNTMNYVRAGLGVLRARFTQEVQDLSSLSADVGERDDSRPAADDDQAMRAVTVTVSWRPAERNRRADDLRLRV